MFLLGKRASYRKLATLATACLPLDRPRVRRSRKPSARLAMYNAAMMHGLAPQNADGAMKSSHPSVRLVRGHIQRFARAVVVWEPGNSLYITTAARLPAQGDL